MSIINKLQLSKEIITSDDGFKYFWPEITAGMLSAENLREIADYLDVINQPYQTRLMDYLNSSVAYFNYLVL